MQKRALFLLLFSSSIYGLDLITVKKGLMEGISPYLFSVLRTTMCAVYALLFVISKRSKIRSLDSRSLVNIILIGIIAEGIVIVLLFVGQHNTSAVNAGFLIRLTFLFTIPFSYLLLKDNPGKILFIVLPLVTLGAFLISTGGYLTMPMYGDLLIISAAVCLGYTNALAKDTMKNVPVDIVTSGRFVFGSLFLLLVILPLNYESIGNLSAQQHIYVLLSSFFYGSFVVSFYRAINLAGPNIASMFFTAGAVFSAVFAVILLGETVSAAHVLGALFLISGAYILQKKR